MTFKIGDVVQVCISTWYFSPMGIIENIYVEYKYPFIIRYQQPNGTHMTVVVKEEEIILVKK